MTNRQTETKAPNTDGLGSRRRVQEASFNGQYWIAPNFGARGDEISFAQAQVTHWKPMPAPPKQEGSG